MPELNLSFTKFPEWMVDNNTPRVPSFLESRQDNRAQAQSDSQLQTAQIQRYHMEQDVKMQELKITQQLEQRRQMLDAQDAFLKASNTAADLTAKGDPEGAMRVWGEVGMRYPILQNAPEYKAGALGAMNSAKLKGLMDYHNAQIEEKQANAAYDRARASDVMFGEGKKSGGAGSSGAHLFSPQVKKQMFDEAKTKLDSANESGDEDAITRAEEDFKAVKQFVGYKDDQNFELETVTKGGQTFVRTAGTSQGFKPLKPMGLSETDKIDYRRLSEELTRLQESPAGREEPKAPFPFMEPKLSKAAQDNRKKQAELKTKLMELKKKSEAAPEVENQDESAKTDLPETLTTPSGIKFRRLK